jgi:segregation and condensation protein A
MVGESELVRASEDSAQSMPKFEVDVLGWHGPYDLILQVIDEQELNLLDLDISKLLEHYLQYLEGLTSIDIDEAGDFLVVAATLAQIKSKMLLPADESAAVEEVEVDPRAELVRYLQEYQKFKEAAKLLQDRPLLGRDVFTKGAREQFEGLELEGRGQLFQLVKGFQKAWIRTETKNTYQIEQEEVSVSERLQEVFELLQEKKQLTFDEILIADRGRIFLIASFLAVLELVRLKKMRISQMDSGETLFLNFIEGASDEDVMGVHSEFDESEETSAGPTSSESLSSAEVNA